MPFDEGLATRLEDVVRNEFDAVNGLEETRMFGGFGYLLNGNMCVGIHKDTLIIRVGAETAASLIDSEAHVRAMDFTGRVMKAWATIEPDAMADDNDLTRFVRHAVDFVSDLPPK